MALRGSAVTNGSATTASGEYLQFGSSQAKLKRNNNNLSLQRGSNKKSTNSIAISN